MLSLWKHFKTWISLQYFSSSSEFLSLEILKLWDSGISLEIISSFIIFWLLRVQSWFHNFQIFESLNNFLYLSIWLRFSKKYLSRNIFISDFSIFSETWNFLRLLDFELLESLILGIFWNFSECFRLVILEYFEIPRQLFSNNQGRLVPAFPLLTILFVYSFTHNILLTIQKFNATKWVWLQIISHT